MITLEQLTLEKNQILTQLEAIPFGLESDHKKQIKPLKKRLDFLNTCIAYLESGVSENFLLSEKNRLEASIKRRLDSFKKWLAPENADPTQRRSLYIKEVGLPELEKQLKTVNFILG